MPWGSGTFTRSNGTYTGSSVWASDAGASIDIEANRHDTHDQDLAAGINACLNKDGSNAATGNLDIGGYRLTNVGAATAVSDAARASQVQNSTLMWGGTAGGTANALTLTLTPAIGAYAAGQVFRFIAASSNTGPCTLNVNGLGIKDIKKRASNVSVSPADITAGQQYEVMYDGTRFKLLAPADQLPVGAVMPYAGSSAPAGGWLLCDGSAVSRTDYAELFAILSTTYGAGDGATTFNVPDMRQRFPLGKASSGTGSTLGGTGGNIDHTHSTPAHSHNAGTLAANIDFNAGILGIERIAASFTANVNGTLTSVGTSYAATTGVQCQGATATDGSGTSGAGNPPFLAVNYIIKT